MLLLQIYLSEIAHRNYTQFQIGTLAQCDVMSFSFRVFLWHIHLNVHWIFAKQNENHVNKTLWNERRDYSFTSNKNEMIYLPWNCNEKFVFPYI